MPKELPGQVTIDLTEREQEILRLLATGTSNKDIARQLFISSNTVKVHLHNIFAKIGAVSRTEAVMYAIRIGLVKSPKSDWDERASAELSIESITPLPETSKQDEGIPGEGGILTAHQTPAIQVSSRSRLGFRTVSVAAVFTILIVVIGLGFILARQRPSLTIGTSQATATPESRWHILASLPTARDGLAVTAYENMVYAIGGETAQGVTGLVERYDPPTDSWVELSRKPIPVTDVHAAVIGGKIYIPGGRTISGTVTDALEIYDPRQDAWEKGANMPIAMSAYAMATFEGRLYLFGGWDGQNYLNTVYIYRPESESWLAGKPMSIARGFAGAAVAGGMVYVVGGENKNGKLSVNEVSNLSLASGDVSDWQTDEPLPVAVSGIGLINVADLVYAVVSTNGVDGIYVYYNGSDVRHKSWEFLSMPFEFGSQFSTIMLGTRLYIMGGYLNKKQLSLNVSYDAIYTIVLPITK